MNRRGKWKSKINVIIAFIICGICFFISGAAQGQTPPSPIEPTIQQDPAKIDEAWRAGSAKYDAKRAELLNEVKRGAAAGPYLADWESLKTYEIPEWFRDAKFGIFIHWGLYSVPGFGNEWYPRNMYRQDSDEYKHHLQKYGSPAKFGYKDFIPMFKAEKFDPQAWAKLFKDSGAKYVVPVFEHHDGFAMYDCGLSDWTAAKMGPKRDLGGELAQAVRNEGLHFGASSHRVEHDFFLAEGRKIASDVNDPKFAAFYGPAHSWMEGKSSLLEDWTYVSNEYLDDWMARDAEIVLKYQPEIVWFDWWIGQPEVRRHLQEFTAFYYNESAKRGKLGVINYKLSAMPEHSAVLDVERGQLKGIRPLAWQTDTSVSNKSWGYIEHDNFKSAEFLVRQLVDIVSKNGNLLLNVGPRSDGTIPEEEQKILLEMGAWLKINGESIYGTRPWKKFGEGPTNVIEGQFHDTDAQPFTAQDFRFTSKGNLIYAIEMGWPAQGEAVIHSLNDEILAGKKIASITLLATELALKFEQKSDGLHIQVPPQAPGEYAYAYKMMLQ
jgi:alpha-L-fucosidase